MKTKLLLVMLVVTGLGLVVSANAGTRGQDLPDYTKAPFHRGNSGACNSSRHPEFGALTCVEYVTNEEPVPGTQAVVVGSGADGKPRAAVWYQIREDVVVGRVYIYKKNTWVFEKEGTAPIAQ